MPDTETVAYEHAGATWNIPVDLIELQRSWDAADAACRALAEADDPTGLDQARARRLDLTSRIHDHPWLLAAMAQGRRYQADMALKACARSAPADGTGRGADS